MTSPSRFVIVYELSLEIRIERIDEDAVETTVAVEECSVFGFATVYGSMTALFPFAERYEASFKKASSILVLCKRIVTRYT